MTKPAKPFADYPLFAHACGKWAKKIEGKTVYFGTWDEPDKALSEYRAYIADKDLDGQSDMTLSKAANLFLAAKNLAVENGLLANRTYSEYKSTLKAMLNHWGREFPLSEIDKAELVRYYNERSETRNLVSMGNECVRIKTIFFYLEDKDLIEEAPKFPEEFKKPSRKLVRRHKREVGSKVISQADMDNLLFNAGGTLKPMILLAVQAGFSPADIANLKLDHVNYDEGKSGWINMPRVKTEIDRYFPMLPETAEALKDYVARRPKPARKEDQDYLFLTPSGSRMNPDKSEFTPWFSALSKQCGLKATAYWLRHTCQNVAEKGGDMTAVKMLMGHADQSISDTYRHEIEDSRMYDVVSAIGSYLFTR